jgi:hypothetical protein
MNRGFIKVGEDANFDMRVGRRARRWILTTRPMGNARKATDDWKKYKIKSPSD